MPIIRFTERTPFNNPWAEFERIRKGLDDLSKTCIKRGMAQNRTNVYPAINIFEQADRLVITAELPGVIADDLDVSVEGETLTIQGKRNITVSKKEISYHRREIETGSFSRAINLPIKIDLDNLSASLTSGMLTITLMKAAAVTPKKITIQSTGEGTR